MIGAIKNLTIFIARKCLKLLGYDMTFTKRPTQPGYDVTISKGKSDSMIIVDKHTWQPYFSNDERMQLYFKGLQKSGNEESDNFYKQLRFHSLQQMVHYVTRRKISGDFVECGVWKGHSAYMIADIISKSDFRGNLHIFDSFEGGLSDKSDKDKGLRDLMSEKKIMDGTKVFSSTEDEVRDCLSEFKFVQLYKGWIPTRFKEVEDKKFAFVHIDVNLYQPFIDSLNFFYPRLAEGGIIVCDDYGLTQYPGAKTAVDEFLMKNKYSFFYEVPMGACFVIK